MRRWRRTDSPTTNTAASSSRHGDCAWADLIVVFEPQHIALRTPEPPKNAAHRAASLPRLLRDLAPATDGPLVDRRRVVASSHEVEIEPWEEVVDPAGGDQDVFHRVRERDQRARRRPPAEARTVSLRSPGRGGVPTDLKAAGASALEVIRARAVARPRFRGVLHAWCFVAVDPGGRRCWSSSAPNGAARRSPVRLRTRDQLDVRHQRPVPPHDLRRSPVAPVPPPRPHRASTCASPAATRRSACS